MPATLTSGAMSARRRERLRLEISREAARLFWQQGVAATSGEQIAAAVGLSVRTLWRHFRTKESCVEPIMSSSVEWFVGVMGRWPRELSLEEHLVAERRRLREAGGRTEDDVLQARMIVLARTEPAVRAAWLTACHAVEGELATVIGERLGRPVDDPEIQVHAATATAAVRVISEQLYADATDRDDDPVADADLDRRLARAVSVATGGAVGDPLIT